VVCFNRGLSGNVPDGAELLMGDRRDRESFERTVSSTSYEIAIDLTCFNADDAASSVRAFLNVGCLVHCSSIATYGRNLKKFPAFEWTPLKPENEYARGKAEADKVILAGHLNNSLPATIIRPAICYGPKIGLLRQLGQDCSWLSRIRAGRPLLVCGDGIALHQFMHVDDLAEAIFRISLSDDVVGEVFNVVNPNVISWKDYHLTAMDILGRSVELVGASAKTIFSESEKVGHQVLDIFSHNSYFSDEKLRGLTGFLPKITLRDGMKSVIEELDAASRIPHVAEMDWEDKIIASLSYLGAIRDERAQL
jgi:nucleoside-diphosphate-sugar epimerase